MAAKCKKYWQCMTIRGTVAIFLLLGWSILASASRSFEAGEEKPLQFLNPADQSVVIEVEPDKPRPEGGFAVIYLGTDLGSGNPVAVKVLKRTAKNPHDPTFEQKIIANNQMIQRLHGLFGGSAPGLIPILDVKQLIVPKTQKVETTFIMPEGRAFVGGFQQEIVLGDIPSLDSFKRRWPVHKEIFADLVAGLWILRLGLVNHNDISPNNIILLKNGRFVFADFDGMTPFGKTNKLGKVTHIAPERFGGKTHALSDFFNLGLTLYEYFFNEHPATFWGRQPSVPTLLIHPTNALSHIIQTENETVYPEFLDFVAERFNILIEHLRNIKANPGHRAEVELYRDFILACLQKEPQDRLTRLRDLIGIRHADGKVLFDGLHSLFGKRTRLPSLPAHFRCIRPLRQSKRESLL
jgi:serine/threonine protein kinase